MERIVIPERPDWVHTVQSLGLIYHHTEHPDGSNQVYWNEGACYRFDRQQIATLEKATNVLTHMCMAAAQEVIEHDRFADLGIPAAYVDAIKESWNGEPPSVYGRFDFHYDGVNPPKMLEFNADTPTALVESAVIQWHWFEDRFHKRGELDQWNSIHDRLVGAWKKLQPYLEGDVVHVAHCVADTCGEDLMNSAYMRDCIDQAGYKSVGLRVEDIGWNKETNEFVDLDNLPIKTIFKLYPWEWLLNDEFGEHVLETLDKTQWVEPIWKMVLSNKGILPILWELFPNHPNLLESYFSHPHGLKQWARKPLLSREGANIMVVTEDEKFETDGEYGEEGFIFQDWCPLPEFDGNFPVIGSWVIGLESAGCSIRESDGLITDNLSRFVPHVISDGPIDDQLIEYPDDPEAVSVVAAPTAESVAEPAAVTTEKKS